MANLLEDLKRGASDVVQRGRRSVDGLAVWNDRRGQVGKLAARARQLNREHGEVITEIGKKTYALHTQGKVTNKDVLRECERIDAIADEITSLQDKMESIRRSDEGLAVRVELEDAQTALSDESVEEDAAPEAEAQPEPEAESTPEADESDSETG